MARGLQIALASLLFFSGCLCLRMVMLDVPNAAHQGESVDLACVYELEGDVLYSIKWYKDDIEFYRYVPNDWPPGQFLPLPGVRVDLAKSGHRSVHLRSVDLNSTGTYRCEVSAEAPSFQSVVAEGHLDIVVLPTEGPRIGGGQAKYSVGDTVVVNCTSAKSKPAATLQWYINDEPAGSEYETEYSTTLHEDGLESSSLGLKFVARERHFSGGSLRLRCTAAIRRMYDMSDEEVFGRQQTSPLQVAEEKQGRVNEKPLRSVPNQKKKGPKQMQTANSGCGINVSYSLFLVAVAFLLPLRIT